nr:chorismate lyase [Mannheimia haemolytica]
MYSLYLKILSECDWCCDPKTLSTYQQEWLLHEGSLTQKLYDVATNFNVEVVQEKWIAKNSEKTTACNEDVWSREVLLKDGEKIGFLPKLLCQDQQSKISLKTCWNWAISRLVYGYFLKILLAPN